MASKVTSKTTKTRTVSAWDHAHQCDQCKAEGVFTPATHSVSDSQETEFDGWQPGAANHFGCDKHTVEPRVIFKDGSSMPFKDYQVN